LSKTTAMDSWPRRWRAEPPNNTKPKTRPKNRPSAEETERETSGGGFGRQAGGNRGEESELRPNSSRPQLSLRALRIMPEPRHRPELAAQTSAILLPGCPRLAKLQETGFPAIVPILERIERECIDTWSDRYRELRDERNGPENRQ
jgi:hypothetical protein